MKILRKARDILASIIGEFIEGFLPEYLLTGIAGTIFMFYYEIAGGFKEFEGGFWIVFVIDAILMTLGVRATTLNSDHINKIIAIVDHGLTFFIIGFVGKFVLSLLIGIAVICGIIIWFKGAESITSFFSAFTPSAPYPENTKKEEVEVWREKQNGSQEKLRVNSSQDMYYDPDDGEWHKIQK